MYTVYRKQNTVHQKQVQGFLIQQSCGLDLMTKLDCNQYLKNV